MVAPCSRGISSALIAVLIMSVVVISGATAIIVYSTSGTSTNTSSALTSPAYVTVFGFVSTTGAGTLPVSMVFTSARTGSIFVAPATEGRFSIQLPNHDVYAVVTKWAGNYTSQVGETERGQLPINVSAGSNDAMSYNVVESTPASIVEVDGLVGWQIITSNPIGIRFTSTSGGENFTASISADRRFSIRLPNAMNYEVYIESQSREWYYAHQLEVKTGVNVVGITVKIAL